MDEREGISMACCGFVTQWDYFDYSALLRIKGLTLTPFTVPYRQRSAEPWIMALINKPNAVHTMRVINFCNCCIIVNIKQRRNGLHIDKGCAARFADPSLQLTSCCCCMLLPAGPINTAMDQSGTISSRVGRMRKQTGASRSIQFNCDPIKISIYLQH